MRRQDYFAAGRGYFRSSGRFRRYTGGLLVEKACHSFDLMGWMLRANPLRVSCFARLNVFAPRDGAAMHCRDCRFIDTCPDAVRQAGRNDLCVYNSEKDNDDTEGLLIQYDSGVIGTYLEVFYSPTIDRRYRIVGTEGEIQASEELGTIRLCRLGERQWRQEQIDYPPGGHRGADPLMVSAAVDYFLGRGRDDRTVGADAGRMSVLLGLAAHRAGDEGRVVELAEMTSE